MITLKAFSLQSDIWSKPQAVSLACFFPGYRLYFLVSLHVLQFFGKLDILDNVVTWGTGPLLPRACYCYLLDFIFC